jgi:hypothetical protein
LWRKKIKNEHITASPTNKLFYTLGRSTRIFIVDYGQWVNTVWVCRMCETGEVKHFDSNDIKIEGNPTLDEKFLKL